MRLMKGRCGMKNYKELDSCVNCVFCIVTEADYDIDENYRCNVNNDFVAWIKEELHESKEEKKIRQENNEKYYKWMEIRLVTKNGKCDLYERG